MRLIRRGHVIEVKHSLNARPARLFLSGAIEPKSVAMHQEVPELTRPAQNGSRLLLKVITLLRSMRAQCAVRLVDVLN